MDGQHVLPSGFPPPQQMPQQGYPPQTAPTFAQGHMQPQQGGQRGYQQHLKPTRRGGKRRGGKNRHHLGGRQPDSGAPSLASLSAQNRQGAQRYFGKQPHDTPRSEAPRTAPHAPMNDNSYILAQHGRRGSGTRNSPGMTPAQPSNERALWTPARSAAAGFALDRDEGDLGAQLDFFGTNEGLVARYSSDDESSGDADSAGSDEEGKWHQAEDSAAVAVGSAGLSEHVRARLASQSAYIQQLEQQNLDLQEKYSLLQHELQELKAARAPAAPAPPHALELDDTAAVQPEPAADVGAP